MKKIILLLGVMAGIVSTAQAQARLGLKAGLGLANVTGSDTDELSNLITVNAGGMVDFSINEQVSFHPELLFSQKGAQIESKDPYGSGGVATGTVRLNYVDVPLLMRIKASGLFFELGPQLGFLMSRKTEVTVTYPGKPSNTSSSSGTNGIRKVDAGYVLGLGYQLPQGLELGIRYNGGFLDLSDPSDSKKNYNSVFQFQVGYLFPGK